MNTPARRTPTAPASLRLARRGLLEHGEVPGDALDAAVARSWQRSRQAGLSPCGRMPGAPHASGAQLARALNRQYELVSHARPVMEYFYPHLGQSASMLILADAQGLLLHTLGEAGFRSRAERVALRPGACWDERWRGTNAIGTALVEGTPMVVHGGEHYLERNGFLTCTAAPIFDPAGAVMGVIDISGEQRDYHPHTLGLVRSAACMVEHRLFDTRHANSLRLRLHTQAEGLGTLSEGLVALSEDGWLVGANAIALQALGLRPEAIGATQLAQCLSLPLPALLDWARRPAGAPRVLHTAAGQSLWARLEPGRLSVGTGAPRPPTRHGDDSPARDALAALETGDATLGAAAHKARRVLHKPIAILLQGESGTGKEVFARAVHASGPRARGPFVAVNCAALPEHLIEAELFGYRPGAYTGASRDGAPGRIREAHGGLLFLDEIGDMPLALQARLLRVLQEREVVPLGGGKPVPVDFQLVCATHRQLGQEMATGRFREDLYYRLNGLTLQLPPLRDRSDFAALVQRMLAELRPEAEPHLAPALAEALARHRWPGNLRQLHNALRTACALLDDGALEIDWPHLPDDLAEALREAPRTPAAAALAEPGGGLRERARQTVQQAVAACQGNLSAAARQLGISRNTLYRKLREAGSPA